MTAEVETHLFPMEKDAWNGDYFNRGSRITAASAAPGPLRREITDSYRQTLSLSPMTSHLSSSPDLLSKLKSKYSMNSEADKSSSPLLGTWRAFGPVMRESCRAVTNRISDHRPIQRTTPQVTDPQTFLILSAARTVGARRPQTEAEPDRLTETDQSLSPRD